MSPYRDPARVPRPSAPGEGITNLPYVQAVHVVQALSVLEIPARINGSAIGVVSDYVPLIVPAWLAPILRKIDDTIVNATTSRAPSLTARTLVLLLTEHGHDTFEATFALAGPEAVISLLKKSVMRAIVERAEHQLYREFLTLSRALPEEDP